MRLFGGLIIGLSIVVGVVCGEYSPDANWPIASSILANVFDITKYGAVGNGVHNDTDAFVRAISAANAVGGGRVLVPKLSGLSKYLTGSIFLESNIELYIEEGATILGSPIYTDYQWILGFDGNSDMVRASLINGGYCKTMMHIKDRTFHAGRYPGSVLSPTGKTGFHIHDLVRLSTPEYHTAMNSGSCECTEWKKLENVTIRGGGTIDGSGPSWWYYFGPENTRSDMIAPAWVKNLLIEDLFLTRSPAWTMHLLLEENVMVRNIVIDAGVFYNDNEYDGHNVDGVVSIFFGGGGGEFFKGQGCESPTPTNYINILWR